MKKQFLILLLVIFSVNLTLSANAETGNLALFCQEKNGEMKERFKCPNTSFPLLTATCHFGTGEKKHSFTDGCTGPTGGHRDLFLKSCIAHDLCYHHEPATSAKTQKDCDLEFKDNLLKACSSADDYGKCEKWALTMFRALRVFGSLAYRCDNKLVDIY